MLGFGLHSQVSSTCNFCQKTLQDIDGKVQGVNTYLAGRGPTQTWHAMDKKCPWAIAAKGGANLQPVPVQMLLSPETRTELHACMHVSETSVYTQNQKAIGEVCIDEVQE